MVGRPGQGHLKSSWHCRGPIIDESSAGIFTPRDGFPCGRPCYLMCMYILGDFDASGTCRVMRLSGRTEGRIVGSVRWKSPHLEQHAIMHVRGEFRVLCHLGLQAQKGVFVHEVHLIYLFQSPQSYRSIAYRTPHFPSLDTGSRSLKLLHVGLNPTPPHYNMHRNTSLHGLQKPQ